jgi:DNA-binding transcriptional LysR family regulator
MATFLMSGTRELLSSKLYLKTYGGRVRRKTGYLFSVADRKRTDLDWQDVRIFLVLARHGSLSAAARTMAVNHATVSRRLRSLEASLGKKLLERRPEGYVLTAAGSRVLQAAGDMDRAAQILDRDVDDEPSGLVRINASPALSIGFLTDRLSALAARFPRLDIELASNHRFVSLERYEADIAIRFGHPKDGDLVARPLVTVGYGFYGTAETCRSAEAGGDPAFIGFDEANAHLPEATWVARHFPRSRLIFRAKDQFAQAVAARSCSGLALLPHYLGRSDPLLAACKLAPTPPDKAVFLVTRGRDRGSAPVRAISDEIVAMFEENRQLFA